jgi:hypothetical protein
MRRKKRSETPYHEVDAAAVKVHARSLCVASRRTLTDLFDSEKSGFSDLFVLE